MPPAALVGPPETACATEVKNDDKVNDEALSQMLAKAIARPPGPAAPLRRRQRRPRRSRPRGRTRSRPPAAPAPKAAATVTSTAPQRDDSSARRAGAAAANASFDRGEDEGCCAAHHGHSGDLSSGSTGSAQSGRAEQPETKKDPDASSTRSATRRTSWILDAIRERRRRNGVRLGRGGRSLATSPSRAARLS